MSLNTSRGMHLASSKGIKTAPLDVSPTYWQTSDCSHSTKEGNNNWPSSLGFWGLTSLILVKIFDTNDFEKSIKPRNSADFKANHYCDKSCKKNNSLQCYCVDTTQTAVNIFSLSLSSPPLPPVTGFDRISIQTIDDFKGHFSHYSYNNSCFPCPLGSVNMWASCTRLVQWCASRSSL